MSSNEEIEQANQADLMAYVRERDEFKRLLDTWKRASEGEMSFGAVSIGPASIGYAFSFKDPTQMRRWSFTVIEREGKDFSKPGIDETHVYWSNVYSDWECLLTDELVQIVIGVTGEHPATARRRLATAVDSALQEDAEAIMSVSAHRAMEFMRLNRAGLLEHVVRQMRATDDELLEANRTRLLRDVENA